MKLKRQNGQGMFYMGLVAIVLGVINILIQRPIDGSLCVGVGLCLMLVWAIKRRK